MYLKECKPHSEESHSCLTIPRTLPRRPWGSIPSVFDVLGENPKDGYCGSYPAAWVPKPPDGQAFLKMEVVPTEVAYQRVCALFHQSLSEEKTLVLGIYRIRNDDLWEKYTRYQGKCYGERCGEMFLCVFAG